MAAGATPSQPSVEMPVKVGDVERFTVTLTGELIDQFADVSGDRSPVHVDVDYAREHGFPDRIGHGVFLVALMSTAATMMEDSHNVSALSYGYDRVRFTKPVLTGETLSVEYVIDEVMSDEGRYIAACRVTDSAGDVVGVARHISKLVP